MKPRFSINFCSIFFCFVRIQHFKITLRFKFSENVTIFYRNFSLGDSSKLILRPLFLRPGNVEWKFVRGRGAGEQIQVFGRESRTDGIVENLQSWIGLVGTVGVLNGIESVCYRK